MLTMKRHDTRTAIKASLKTPRGNAVDLTGADVKFVMVKYGCRSVVADRDAIVLDAAAGQVCFAFEPGEVAEPGLMLAEFKVTYPDASVERFPNKGYITINIESELS